jgi:hypothetical protein
LRKPVRHKRIPVIQAAAEVLKEDERRSASRTEAPLRVADSISLDEAGWSRDVGVFGHIYLLGYRSVRCAFPFNRMRYTDAAKVKAHLLDNGIVDALASAGATEAFKLPFPSTPSTARASLRASRRDRVARFGRSFPNGSTKR